ncbi:MULTISPECIES: GNAT family N-acetyltransferase [Streptomyces]|uniref:GNAT family N-acetyltransferase n=1 Tax=Streptomyces TaxID=1883 RepID=UPI00163CBE08|nr:MULTISPECIES: GNAT family N-acetyltransferase [Streptomyces]MBC2876518.1 GNAT family N-acetyltransferase [Streptomyces sp. TYQ1024]UBI40809.1 GNAT family N-acetyltransferase [Streptomyces mobaraensis]
MSGGIRVRGIAERDWDAVVALEAGAYTALGLSEGPAALRSRADASPATCFVLDVDSRPAGYLLALPYPAFRCPDLTRPEVPEAPGAPADPAANLHLHDIVVAPHLRRRGLARHLLRHLTRTARARGDERISLVAVGGSETFWSARGFAAHPDVTLPDGYGPHAVYMSRPVTADDPEDPRPGGPAPHGPPVHHEAS